MDPEYVFDLTNLTQHCLGFEITKSFIVLLFF